MSEQREKVLVCDGTVRPASGNAPKVWTRSYVLARMAL